MDETDIRRVVLYADRVGLDIEARCWGRRRNAVSCVSEIAAERDTPQGICGIPCAR
jgi:hypothetical protein